MSSINTINDLSFNPDDYFDIGVGGNDGFNWKLFDGHGPDLGWADAELGLFQPDFDPQVEPQPVQLASSPDPGGNDPDGGFNLMNLGLEDNLFMGSPGPEPQDWQLNRSSSGLSESTADLAVAPVPIVNPVAATIDPAITIVDPAPLAIHIPPQQLITAPVQPVNPAPLAIQIPPQQLSTALVQPVNPACTAASAELRRQLRLNESLVRKCGGKDRLPQRARRHDLELKRVIRNTDAAMSRQCMLLEAELLSGRLSHAEYRSACETEFLACAAKQLPKYVKFNTMLAQWMRAHGIAV